jgi:hypothetical protein
MRLLNGSLLCVCLVFAACSNSSNGGGDSGGGAGGDATGGDSGGGGASGGKGGSGSGGSSASGGSGSGGASQGGSGGAGGAAGAAMGGKGGSAGGGAGGVAMGGAGGTAAGGMAGGMAGAGGVAPVAGASGTGVFVAVGDSAVVLRSVDLGLTWQAAPNIPESHTLDNLAYGNGKFFGGTHNNLIYSSADGVTWQKIGTPLGQWVGGVAFGNNVYVAVGGYGEAWYSSDAVTWTKASGRECSAARSVAFGAGKFTLRSDTSADLCSPTSPLDSNQWWTTTDGKVWKMTAGENGHTADVVYCGDVFKDRKNCTLPAGKGTSSAQGGAVWVAIVNGMIQRSADNGTTWQVIAGTNKSLKAVAFGPKP